jgi:tetratricopeptide (TPR) repeat protein
MNLARIEDYGLEASDMLYSVINNENIKKVEEYFLEKLEEKRATASESSFRYHKEKSLRILNGLYEKLGMADERLRLAREELVDKEDYYRLAKILFEEKRFEEAFDTAKKGLMMPEESYHMNDLYFDIARALIGVRPDMIDFNLSLNVALDQLSRNFDERKYMEAKKIFDAIGKSEDFRSTFFKTIKNRSSAVLAMLIDGELQAAIDTVRTEPDISQGTTIAVSKAALDKGMKQESAMLMRTALERGNVNDLLQVGDLLKVMIDISEMPVLQSLCDRILKNKDRGTALLLIPYLLKKSPELSALLAQNFIKDIPVEMVIKVAISVAQKSPDEGALLCRLRINQDILQSHVHYDKAVSLLSAVREIYAGNEPKWQEFIRKFAAENKSKKKLIEMVRKEFKVVL